MGDLDFAFELHSQRPMMEADSNLGFADRGCCAENLPEVFSKILFRCCLQCSHMNKIPGHMTCLRIQTQLSPFHPTTLSSFSNHPPILSIELRDGFISSLS